MNRTETAALLTLVRAIERTPVTDAEVIAWQMLLEHITYDDAETVWRDHARQSPYPIHPAEIRERVHKIRRDRIAQAGELSPPANLADDPAAQIKWLREERKRIADGGPHPSDLPPRPEIVAEQRRRLGELERGWSIDEQDGAA